MKSLKLNFAFIVLILIIQSGFAQFNVGIIGGLNRSGLSGDKPANATYTTLNGIGIGGILETKVSKYVHVGIQPMYLQRGSKVAYKVKDERDPVDSLKFKIDYLTLPLMFKVYGNNQKTYLISGIDVGFPISASIETLDGSEKEDVLDRLKSVDILVNFGFGVRLPMNRFMLAFELRYVQGLLNLNEPAEEGASPLDFIIRSSGFQLFSSISLPLGKSD
jgi:hypothetical protein